MHVAICDDNTPDRRQLERLLKRESDSRSSTTGILYVDSYGNGTALLANPMQYDVFYVDICQTEGLTGIDVVNGLTEKGVHAPIVLCCSQIDYRRQTCPPNVIFLDKPIKTAELSASIDHALQIKSQAPSMIELREEDRTLYVTEEEILYAVEENRHVTVTLTENRKVVSNTTALNLFAQLEQHPSFFAPADKVILNAHHIANFGFHKAVMADGATFKISKKYINYAKEILEN